MIVPKRVGFLIFPGVQALDVAGPMDAFSAAVINGQPHRTQPCYKTFTVGLSTRTVTAGCGLRLKTHFDIAHTPAMDTLIIPGGSGAREPHMGAQIGTWIASRAKKIRRIVAICTGTYGLAASGLLAGRRVTTHWRYASDLQRRFPTLTVEPDALFLKDDRFYTSAGITAGIDLSLALIEEDYGAGVALAVARDLVVYLKRSGGQAQYSEPLRFQMQSNDRLSQLASWILANLGADLSVESLARRARLGPRQFTRRFRSTFGTTPAAFVETARLDEARERLVNGRANIARVAHSVGFRSDDVFRRSFERQFGVPPRAYRNRFSTSSERTATPPAR